jgi:hypothetical protein
MVIHRRTGCTAHTALRPLVAVLCSVALIATACSNGDGLKAGEAATFVEGYTGEFSLDGEQWTAGGDGESLPEGARVRATDGELRLALRDGTARLAPGGVATVMAQAVQLERGDLLLDSGGSLQATLGDTTVEAGGLVRVTSGLAANVAVYEGAATVRRPAQERDVAGLRQMDLAAFRLAPAGDPLQYRAEDPWDQELLGEAIAFDGEVARLARGMQIEFGNRPQPASFYREFAGRRAVPVLASTAPRTRGRAFGPPSDVLLTMFVAQTIGQGRLVDTIRKVADLRAAGARWGLIAVEFDVASGALVAAVDGLGSERLALAERAPATAQGTTFTGSTTGAGVAAADSSPGAVTAGGTTAGTPSQPSGSSGGGSSGGGSGGSGGGGGGGGDDAPPPGDDDPQGVEKVVSDVVGAVGGDSDDDDEPDDASSPVPKRLRAPEIPLPK